ncbi:hypothetical protein JTE90_028981 [Oedothorax gibbosus]|uniref:Uncharacterized protein n=1 Tax=Oedothorax gibbosus TaxID=931172 RepID=A0AAV6VIQ8_9ARAC|nr:hypothetical protein JTE90_028981 [Oedothorax gibbosus]
MGSRPYAGKVGLQNQRAGFVLSILLKVNHQTIRTILTEIPVFSHLKRKTKDSMRTRWHALDESKIGGLLLPLPVALFHSCRLPCCRSRYCPCH